MAVKKVVLLSIVFFLLTGNFNNILAMEWPQEAGNPQRTGYTPEEPLLPWIYAWSWNGPDPQGGSGNHFYDAGRSSTWSVMWEGRTVLGGGKVYVPALNQGLYALSKDTGSEIWNFRQAMFKATPAYDSANRVVLAGASNGNLYKINADTGQLLGSYSAGSPLNKAVLLVGNFAYVSAENGSLHKVSISNMGNVWTYNANSTTSIPPSFSSSRNIVIYATKDLYVHAVDAQTGLTKWRVKPTSNTPSDVITFEGYWPVVSEVGGVVFVRMNLGNNGLYLASGPRSTFPITNAETRSFLQNNPQAKNLFALSLDNGSEKFIPAVGFGGTEGLQNDGPQIWNGPVPVIKLLPSGKEVGYIQFRSGQTINAGDYIDFRNETNLGEIVLDNTTVSGYQAGDLRFVQYKNSVITITDEQNPLSMAGDVIFFAHWGVSEAGKITDRSAVKGDRIINPILTDKYPTVIRRITSCSNFNTTTHYATCGLSLYQDGKYWPGPGYWVYWNIMDPPAPVRSAYSEGILPRYTYAAEGVIVVEGNGGELFVLKPSGTTGATTTPTVSPQPTATTCQKADINQDTIVDLSDYSIIAGNFLKTTFTNPRTDINSDGIIDLSDYSLLSIQFLRPCS